MKTKTCMRWTVLSAGLALAGAASAQVAPVGYFEPQGTPINRSANRSVNPFANEPSGRSFAPGKLRISDPLLADLTTTPEARGGKVSTTGKSTAPRSGKGRSLDDMDVVEGQIVVLDENGKIVETYVPGKDKIPEYIRKGMAGEQVEMTPDGKPVGQSPSRQPAPSSATRAATEPAPRKPGMFARLFGRNKRSEPSAAPVPNAGRGESVRSEVRVPEAPPPRATRWGNKPSTASTSAKPVGAKTTAKPKYGPETIVIPNDRIDD